MRLLRFLFTLHFVNPRRVFAAIGDDLCDRIATLCNDILSRKATMIAGLTVQTRALGLTNGELWHAVEGGRYIGADTILLPLGVQRARRRAAPGHIVARRLEDRASPLVLG
jgi:hypothetical protein